MNKGSVLMRLDAHQEAVLAIVRGAEPLLRDASLRDVAALARLRWALMRALTAYQHFKHNEIFDPAIARRLSIEAATATRMKRACLAMSEAFRDYVATWSARDVAGEWAAYQPAALAMIDRLKAHVARERSEIAALVEMA